MKKIYLAGGCFWGLEKYLTLIPGVSGATVGYANGNSAYPSYEDVCGGDTGHAETVQVEYDPAHISLPFLLELFYKVIDPTTLNRQGGDAGPQYRTGIYYAEEADRAIIVASLSHLQERFSKPVLIEVLSLQNFYPAEQYHQKYLDKNPSGYCHIGRAKFARARRAVDKDTLYSLPTPAELRQRLTGRQFAVTQHNATEPPFNNEYYNTFAPGIYVDVTTGEPLFSSADKFDFGCGWSSFAKPISAGLLTEVADHSHSMERVEVRSRRSQAHLGHVFPDGPPELSGQRYCINSAALRFVPKERMAAEGYGYLLELVE